MKSAKIYKIQLIVCFFLLSIMLLSFSPTYGNTGNVVERTNLEKKENSVFSTGEWFKVEVKETGVYKIGAAELKNSTLYAAPIEQIALYGNQAKMLSESMTELNRIPTDVQQYAIQLKDLNANGIFDEDDYLLFYAESPNESVLDAKEGLFTQRMHSYASSNYYFLTRGGDVSPPKRISRVDNSDLLPNHETDRYLAFYTHEVEMENPTTSGREWLGESFSGSKSTLRVPFLIPNLIADSLVHARVQVAAAATNSRFIVHFDSQNPISILLETRYAFGSVGYSYISNVGKTSFYASKDLIEVDLAFSAADKATKGWLKSIQLNAWRRISVEQGQLLFRDPSVEGEGSITRFYLRGVAQGDQVWDVTEPASVVQETLMEEGGTSFISKTDLRREFVAFRISELKRPISLTRMQNQNLHQLQGIDYLIVAHPDLLNEAERLAGLHTSNSGLKVGVVSTEQVYNEFSSGKQDPMAIRRLAKRLYDRSISAKEEQMNSVIRFRYLLLFGDGHFDNKNILNLGGSRVVTYQTVNSDHNLYSWVADEAFGFLEDTTTLGTSASLDYRNHHSIAVGRFPVNDLQEAAAMVDKVAYYIKKGDLSNQAVMNDWRNTITLLADDADVMSDRDFVTQLEALSSKLKLSFPQYNIEKIYADAFLQRTNSGGAFYPDVNRHLERIIGKGTLVFNYIGHGSKVNLGLERYITPKEIVGYRNWEHLPLFVTSTCDFGCFDQIQERSGAESLILSSIGGAVAVISASRKISSKERFNSELILGTLSVQKGEQLTVGEALQRAKNLNKDPNNSPINLLGDPALKLSIPQNRILVSKVNNKSIESGKQLENQPVDTLKALSQVSIEGRIVDQENATVSSFDGKLFITVFDKPVEMRTLANDVSGTEQDFSTQKSRIFQGTVSVSKGDFHASFIVPLGIAYHFDYGKISLYASANESDAAGFLGSVVIGGISDEAVITGRETRPRISLYMNDTSFRFGGMTNENPTLLVHIKDDYGINLSDGGIKNRYIEAVLDDNNEQTYLLSDFYEQDQEDRTKGIIRFPLSDLSPGVHRIRVRAWNIYDLSSSTSIEFVVNDSPIFEVGTLRNYPNPVREQTRFVCEFNQADLVSSAEIEFYNMQGGKMFVLRPEVRKEAFSVVYDWNVKAPNGQKLQKGVYVYRFILHLKNGDLKVFHAKCIIL